MIYLSISVLAAETKLPVEVLSLHWLNWNESTTSSTGLMNWKKTSNDSFNFNGKTLADPQQFFLGVTLDSIIRANQIIVWSFTITNTESASLSSKLRSYSTEGFEEKVSYNTLKALTYDITILSETRQVLDENTNTVRFTITGKIPSAAEGKNGLIWWMRDLTLVDTAQYNRVVSQVNVFESVQAAAGSGTTPEEMREVLSSWSEEELIPGIGQEVGDQIEDKVPGAVENALNNHDQHQESQAGSKIDEFKEQLEETINPYFENTTEIRDALHGGLTGVFGYSGTNAVITFPAANNPMADGAVLWPELTVDLGYWWNRLPAALRSMITIYATFVILYCCLSEMLDTINTILIHRELLGMPDDAFGIKAKSWSE